MPRRIGINVLYLVPGQVGGTEVYARRLVDALARGHPEARFTVFCGMEAAGTLRKEGWPQNVDVVALPVRSARKPLRLVAELLLLPVHARRHRIDVLHSLGTTTPLFGGERRVVTVHDLIYDVYPDAFPLAARLGLKAVVPAGARRAHRVQVSSKATRDEVVAAFGIPAEEIDVVALGLGMRTAEPVGEPELRRRLGLGKDPVLLTVAAALPHKNLERLLDAFAALGLERPPRLVLVGHAGRRQDVLRVRAEHLGVTDRVHFTGWITDEELEGLYALASAFVYPSLHEGFGLPVLEAMRRALPVACSDATSLPEVAGDAAVLFDPRSTEAMALAVREVLTDAARRTDLARRGPGRAAEFSWERTAAAAWASYEAAADRAPKMAPMPAATTVSPALGAFLADAPFERGPIHAAVRQAASELPPGSRVLDAGAGEAPYREHFAHCDYRTADWPSSVHAGARAADVIASLDDLPLADESFDAVLCTQVLEHVPEPARVLAELRRVLVPGGRLHLTVPFVGELHEEPWDFYRYTSHALRRLLEEAGFGPVEVRPLSGYFVAMAQLLRNCGPAAGVELESDPRRRAVAAAFRGLARLVAPLDRLDTRRALPIGWSCRATRTGAAGDADAAGT